MEFEVRKLKFTIYTLAIGLAAAWLALITILYRATFGSAVRATSVTFVDPGSGEETGRLSSLSAMYGDHGKPIGIRFSHKGIDSDIVFQLKTFQMTNPKIIVKAQDSFGQRAIAELYAIKPKDQSGGGGLKISAIDTEASLSAGQAHADLKLASSNGAELYAYASSDPSAGLTIESGSGEEALALHLGDFEELIKFTHKDGRESRLQPIPSPQR